MEEPPPQPFALNPAGAITGLIDFNKVNHLKMHRRATTKLADDTFDCVPEDLYQFLKELGDRAAEYSWSDETVGILMIPKPSDDPALSVRHVNLLSNHGEISMDDICIFENTYIKGNSRSAQDYNMLCTCLMSALSKAGKSKVVIWEEQYTIDHVKSENLLLKTIIRESHLDLNATTTSIRSQLSSLDTYIATIDSNVTKFNAHVQLLLNGLKSRGEDTQDLLTNLFKGYNAASDRTFVAYIQRKQEDYEDGIHIEPRQLMMLADNKYKNLLVKGCWNAPSEHEEKIMALETQIQSLKKRKPSTQSEGTPRKKTEQGGGNPRQQGEGIPDPGWKKHHLKPKEGEPIIRQHKGKNWHYCSPQTGGKCSGRWTIHEPKDCKGMNPNKDNRFSTNKKKTPRTREGHRGENANDTSQET